MEGIYHLSNKERLWRTKLFALRPTNYYIQVGFVQGYENNRQPAIGVHKKGSFGSAIVRGLIMTNLTVAYHWNSSMDRPSVEWQLNSRSTRRNCRRSSFSSARRTNPPSNSALAKQISINWKAITLGLTSWGDEYSIVLRSKINNIIRDDVY